MLTLLAAVCAVLLIRADRRGPPRVVYFFKPLTLLFIAAIAVGAGPSAPPVYRGAILIGLAFSLAGDSFLMLPSDRFAAGLASFLVAHVAYIAAFASQSGLALTPWAPLPFLGAGVVLFRILAPGAGRLKGPVLAYVLAIGAMAWQALEWWLATGASAALLALAGAVWFAAADSLLAINRFRRPLPAAQALVLGSYFIAQWLIALSVARLG